MPQKKPSGTLIIIGGREAKSSDGDRAILEEVAKAAAKSRLVVITAATHLPEELWEDYRAAFRELGVKKLDLLDVRTREDGYDEQNLRKLTDDAVVFFTGGDQLRITSQLGDSLVFRRMRELYDAGGVICGTSAGAAAAPETMLVAGPSDASGRISALEMAPGLGLIRGVVIDSHFAERGRMGRLLGAVAQNPRNVGLGIDENTAIVVEGDGGNGVGDGVGGFRVIGAGAVYVVDGQRISFSSLSEKHAEGVLTICNATVHVLGDGDRFHFRDRKPVPASDHDLDGIPDHRDSEPAGKGNENGNGTSNGDGDGDRPEPALAGRKKKGGAKR
ncbi:MAG TPA: cyanophycinase [Tepidisphaeraceae bacterium]|nr:cyanophycinase [Tepidisphaeraceae bacterium]